MATPEEKLRGAWRARRWCDCTSDGAKILNSRIRMHFRFIMFSRPRALRISPKLIK